MRKQIIAGLLAVALLFSGCTSTQTIEADGVKVLQAIDDSLATADNPGVQAQIESWLTTLAALAPPTGPIHQAIVDAQAALNALQRGQGTVTTVQLALQTVINLLEGQGKIPLGAVRHHVSGVKKVPESK